MLNSARILEITIIRFDPCQHAKTGGGRLNTVSANHMRFEVCTLLLCWQQKLNLASNALSGKMSKTSGSSASTCAKEMVAVLWLSPEQI